LDNAGAKTHDREYQVATSHEDVIRADEKFIATVEGTGTMLGMTTGAANAAARGYLFIFSLPLPLSLSLSLFSLSLSPSLLPRLRAHDHPWVSAPPGLSL
jgi:hypothetical protein